MTNPRKNSALAALAISVAALVAAAVSLGIVVWRGTMESTWTAAIPRIDAAAPAVTETATFALG